MIPRPDRYPNVDDIINFVQFKMHSRRGKMVSTGLVLFAIAAVAVAPSLLHSREAPARQATDPPAEPIDIGSVPTEAPTTSSSLPSAVDVVPVGDPGGPRFGGDLPSPTTTPPATAPRATLPPQTSPPQTAPPQTAPPQTAPPQTAPPATTPLTVPVDGPIVVGG